MVGLTFATEIRYVDTIAAGANNGSSWSNAYNHLQDALSVSSSGDEIRVAEGFYKPDQGPVITPGDRTVSFQLKNGVAIYGGFPSGGSQWENRNPTVYETILSGDLNGDDGPDFTNNVENSYHVVTGSNTNATAKLDGFTVTGGNANSAIDPDYRGGGMYINSGTPTLTNCIFSWNSAQWGAGIHNESGSPILTNCVFKGNSASYRSGGMYNRSSSYPVLISCTFTENSAVDAGGGMGNGGSNANPTLTNCIFAGNSAKSGGGMSGRGSSSPTLTNCTFWGNSASDSGGGIWSYWSSTIPNIDNCIIWGNSDSGGTDESAQIHDGTPVINYSCIQGWTGSLGGISNIGYDPLFKDMNSHNFHLLQGSPCIDAGDNSAIPPSVLTDLDGNPRIINGRVDIGAYEGYVVNYVYYVDKDSTGDNNGANWTNAYNHLQDALDAASGGDEIKVAEGVYKPDQGLGITQGDRSVSFQLTSGVTIKGGYEGFGKPDPNVRDIEVYETILSGDLNGNDESNFANNSENSYHVVTGGGTNASAALDGFTITGGNADGSDSDGCGGGVYNNNGSSTLSNCIFISNSAKDGAGMLNEYDSSPILTYCIFSGNLADVDGGGMLNAYNSSPTLTSCTFSANVAAASSGGMLNYHDCNAILMNCLFNNNNATDYGGAMMNLHNSNAVLTNCTIIENSAIILGGGVYDYNCVPTLTNCILWNNSDSSGTTKSAQIYTAGATEMPVINYSCLQGWTGALGGIGNIGADPCFADADNGDYHLKSQAGRWKPSIYTKLDPADDDFIDLTDFAAFASSWGQQGESIPADLDNSGLVDLADLKLLFDNYLANYLGGNWVIDDVTSPCIDAGNTNSNWTAELWPHDLCINIGAFGGTKQASMSLSSAGNIADLNIDGFVNYEDMKLFSNKWLCQEVLLSEDLNRNGFVNFTDFAVFASEWLWEGTGWEPGDSEAVVELRRLINEKYSYWQLRGVDWDNLFDIYSPAMNEAQTPEEFAELAAELLAHAEDAHIRLYIGSQYFTVFRRSVEQNYNLNVLPTLVPNWQYRNSRVSTGRFPDGIGYILINSWSWPEDTLDAVFQALDDFSDTHGLIIDVRTNGGGSETLAKRVAGCFIAESKLYAKHRYRDITQPDGFGPVNSRWLDPNPGYPRYTGQVAVLMGQVCMSSCDAFLLMMKQVTNCNLIGVTSYGSSGNSKPHNLPNGVTVDLPSWLALRPDETCFEGEGIFPHITVEATQEELLTHDPILEAALNILREP